jgi:site-specific DNA-methyltransferase (cytosine-N4-specific)
MTSHRILEGNVFDLLPTLAPGSVDCVVTSPPYWRLRSYLPKGHPLKALELGSEKTPEEYVGNMVRVFALVREAMAPHATLWLNVGDSYASSGLEGSRDGLAEYARRERGAKDNGPKNDIVKPSRSPTPEGMQSGNLCLIPQRLALALQADGWIVRSWIIWRKPSAMPQSVKSWAWRRCRVKVGNVEYNGTEFRQNRPSESSHSSTKYHKVAQWQLCPGCKKCTPHGGYVLSRGSWRPTSSYEPIFMLAKSSNYFADGEPVKTKAADSTVNRDKYTRILDDPDEQFAVAHDHETESNGEANLRDVWDIAAEALEEKHYAAFPTELVHRCLAAGTSAGGYCSKCGKPWARVLGATDAAFRPSCSCKAPSRPALVLDPFCGSGRAGIEAMRMGLDFIGCELNPEYVEMARQLLREEAPLFAGNLE